ncbi:hypothetical protein [Streptomyces sp. NPDC056512]|uniref:hypothetical protein n=1 Tax=Streptomyces sp. NPDC056512 TaxID=3345846 RepID=UPI0036BB009F
MSTEEQATPASGSVPHAYGNALAWKWSRQMPTPLRRGFLTLLYALRAMANANGELKFHSDHKAIRIQDIAKAAGADEKDARRYIEAAIRAGVVGTKGERKRGKATLYTLAVTPWPNWEAAEAYLDATKRERPGRKPGPWTEKNGGRSPEPEESKFGGPAPELTGGTEKEVQGTAPRMSSGDHPPIGSGDRPPNNPGSTHEISQEAAGVVFQPQVVGATGTTDIAPQDQEPHDNELADFVRCARCHRPMLPRHGRTTHPNCPPVTAEHRSAS